MYQYTYYPKEATQWQKVLCQRHKHMTYDTFNKGGMLLQSLYMYIQWKVS